MRFSNTAKFALGIVTGAIIFNALSEKKRASVQKAFLKLSDYIMGMTVKNLNLTADKIILAIEEGMFEARKKEHELNKKFKK